MKCPVGKYAESGYSNCKSCPQKPANSYYKEKPVPASGPVQSAQAYACQFVCESGTIGVSGCYTPYEFALRQGGGWQVLVFVCGLALLTLFFGWLMVSPSTGGLCDRRVARGCAVVCGGTVQFLCCCGCCCGCFGFFPACSRYMPARVCRCQAGCCSCASTKKQKGGRARRLNTEDASGR